MFHTVIESTLDESDKDGEEVDNLGEDDDDDEDILIRLQRRVNKSRSVCCPLHEQKVNNSIVVFKNVIFSFLCYPS